MEVIGRFPTPDSAPSAPMRKIDAEQLLRLAERMKATGYRQHLMRRARQRP
jgi:hypothetical protein